MSIHRRLKGILKIAVALLLLAWVFYQVEPQRIAGYLQNLSGWHVIASLVFAMLAHSAGAMRLRWFVQAAGAPIAPGFALRLNFIGVFFSFVLPIGGFGGDIVKLAALRNKIGLGMARGVQILVADRLSGLLLFCLMSLGLLAWVDIAVLLPFAGAWLVAGVLLAVCCYFFLSLRFLGQNLRTCLGGIVYSVPVVLLWMGSFAALWHDMAHAIHMPEYLLFFCIGCVLAAVPVSVGGLGVREAAFLYGAYCLNHFMGYTLDEEIGVAMSLAFFAVHFCSSLPGAVLWQGVVNPAKTPASS